MSADTFFLVTLGCKVNQYESHALREAWTARGFTETGARDAAVVCVNTCAVTARAVADARAAVRRVYRENPCAAITVTGCAAQVLPGEFQSLPGVARVVSNRDKVSLLSLCGGIFPPEKQAAENAAAYPPFSVNGYDRSRAVLKVQDGCSHGCAYCIVPLARGASRSRDPHEALAEAERLLGAGFREIVINGVNLSQYGRDFSRPYDFWDLAAFLEKELAPRWAGRARLRLSSLEPGQLGAKALDVLGRGTMIAPHVHVSLQSGSVAVLRRMGRGHYDPAALPEFFRELATIFPRFGLGADFLSGFPGETDEDAATTECMATALPFTYAHVFPYSRRPGTPAAGWGDQVPLEVKKQRAARLRAIFAVKGREFMRACLDGAAMRVAWENAPGIAGGVNEFYTECRFAGDGAPTDGARGSLVAAEPIAAGDGHLIVRALPGKGEGS